MADLTEILHDRVDSQEELKERAEAIVESMKPQMARLLNEGIDVEQVVEMLVAEISKKLDPLTSEAVKRGAEFGRRIQRA